MAKHIVMILPKYSLALSGIWEVALAKCPWLIPLSQVDLNMVSRTGEPPTGGYGGTADGPGAITHTIPGSVS
jgi:hypothetical protein